MPTQYFAWGLYYRKDLFEKVGITKEPTTWQEFLDDCKKLKAAGIAPIAVGGRDSWTLAAWFDYLDLRMNGYDFHLSLMNGEIPYTDARVKNVYLAWKTLIDNKYFIDNPLSYSLDSVQPLYIQGQAAMMLMGTFLSPSLPPATKAQTGFFKFPVIDPKVTPAEDGSARVPEHPRAGGQQGGRTQIPRVRRTARQRCGVSQRRGYVAANNKAAMPDDAIAKIGFQILSHTTGGVAQFYDRDMTKEMADEGMKGMQRFISDPSKLDGILSDLEKTRKRIYHKS